MVPVLDEQDDLEPSVRRLHGYLLERFPYSFRITIADDASSDDMPAIAARLARELPHLVSLRMPEKGRGRALRELGRREVGRRELGRAAPQGRGGTVSVAGVPIGMPRQLVRFAAIGVVSTLVHLGLFLLLRSALGPIGANLVALLITAVGNTAANRRLTFGLRGREGTVRHQFQGLIVLGLGLALTTGALAALGAWAPGAGRLVELAVLVAANALATVLRFVAFRSWVFRGTREARPQIVTPDVSA